jgi:hypothetical protein
MMVGYMSTLCMRRIVSLRICDGRAHHRQLGIMAMGAVEFRYRKRGRGRIERRIAEAGDAGPWMLSKLQPGVISANTSPKSWPIADALSGSGLALQRPALDHREDPPVL